MDEHFFLYNGRYFHQDEPVINIGNRALRYGDGMFETMRMCEGRIWNLDFHIERLLLGMKTLQFDIPEFFSREFFLRTVNELLLKNSNQMNARIRLMIIRGDGNILDYEKNSTNYIIETWPLSNKIGLNENGLIVDLFPDARKSCDQFSNLKSNNYLPSAMAALFAQRNNLDDSIIMNSFERVCESSIANIFIINDENIYTPPLSEGCVAGVMRRWMLEKFALKDFKVIEKNLSIDELMDADEFFLTNTIQPIRWVRNFRGKIYKNDKTKEIFQYIIRNI